MSRYKVDICGLKTSDLPVLSNHEMMDLFKRYQKGEIECKETLVNGNLKLVLSMVQRFINRTDNLDDLFQIGCIGLIKAIDNFDLKHEVRFSTYAVPMIIGEMKRYLRDGQMIKISRQLKDQSYKCLQMKEQFLQQNQFEPSYLEIAKELSISEHDVHMALETLQGVVSIYEPMYSDEGDSIQLVDQIEDSNDEIRKLNDQISIQSSMKLLNEKEREIIYARYYDGKTQTELAKEMGISQAQVSRMEKNALNCLKKNL